MTISFAAPVTNPFGLRDVGSKSTPTFVDLGTPTATSMPW